jgi:hypothetical protein
MTTWTADDLERFGEAEEVRIAGMRRDGSLRKPVIVWVVRVDDELYTRSVNGPGAATLPIKTSTAATPGRSHPSPVQRPGRRR